ncbi:hypothetical protein NPIL_272091 [Nephila pilipes]|uniref:Uncharacterized protein n=1 Tax=Nephila pilipes TaxID=299642 RepID=A0A8X6P747_NEPPI|nr:hypothetical protein NPIL_272091 [Nephila pilipes]
MAPPKSHIAPVLSMSVLPAPPIAPEHSPSSPIVRSEAIRSHIVIPWPSARQGLMDIQWSPLCSCVMRALGFPPPPVSVWYLHSVRVDTAFPRPPDDTR